MRFSVALCTYNGERFIEQQLRSILNQTVKVHEIVICDDSPRPDTAEIAERILKDSGVAYQIFRNNPPLGVSENFLKALRHTSGDYVFTCDQDDIWHADKVEQFRSAVLKTHKALYFSDGVLVDAEARPMGCGLWEAYGVDKALAAGGPICHMLVRTPMVTGAAMLVSRELIQRIDRVPQLWLHDEWLAMAAAVRDDIAPIFTQTFDYRQHGNNVVGAMKRTFAQKLEIWLSMLKKLEDFRKERLKKAEDTLQLAAGTDYAEWVQDAVAFWQALVDLPNLGFFKRIARVFRLHKQGGYSRFYTGIRGAVRDLMSCLLKTKT